MTRPVGTAGPLALLGGGEHRPGCEPIDRQLLDATGVAAPRVVIVPSASLPGTVAATASLARTYWHGLGATPRVVVPGRLPAHAALEAVAEADLVVLPGGVPERLFAALGASPLGEAVLDRWRAGAALSGSSAGAMVLFAWRLRIASSRPLALTPGLGALHGYVAAPHFDRFVRRWEPARRLAERHRRGLRGLGVLGLDEATALVGADGRFVVVGRGAVTVGDAAGWRVHHAGATLDLPSLGGDTGAPARVAPDRHTVAPHLRAVVATPGPTVGTSATRIQA